MADNQFENSEEARGRGVARTLTGSVRAMGRALPRSTPSSTPVSDATRATSAVVDCGLYVQGARKPGTVRYDEAFRQAEEQADAFVWLGLHEPSEAEFADIATTFGLHELAVEDAVRAFQRPKLERYGDVTFVVIKTARYVEDDALTSASEVVETGEVMLFIGPAFVVSVRHGDACRLDGVRAELEHRPDLLMHGPWAVFYAVTDRIVDKYVEVASDIEDDIDDVEVSVFSRNPTDVQRIYQLKREIVEFRRAVSPLDRPLQILISGAVTSVPAEIRQYIRDIADHHIRVTDQIAASDELLNSILQANLAQVGIQQNNDMRKISAWVAIAAVQTVIAGIYGMNFRHMPELNWTFGYPVVLGGMALLGIIMYRIFKKTGWL